MIENLNLDTMRAVDGYLYVATPYSHYPGGIQDACAMADRCGGWLAAQGLSLFVPISLTHRLAEAANLDPFDHAFWLAFDRPFMRAATGLVVAMMPGWRDSFGVRFEIDEFESAGKPIFYMRWPRE